MYRGRDSGRAWGVCVTICGRGRVISWGMRFCAFLFDGEVLVWEVDDVSADACNLRD